MSEALQRLSIARIQVARKLPYYHRIAYSLRPVEQPGLGTVAVTADHALLFDEAAIAKWDDAEVPAVLLHEVLHLALRHPARIATLREADGAAFDAYRANACADFEANRIIRALGMTLPEGALFAEAYNLPRNVLLEEAYRLLAERKRDQPDNGGGQADKDGDQPDKGDVCRGRCGGCAGNPVDGEADVPQAAKVSPLEQQAIERQVAEAIVEANAKDPGCVPADILRQAEAVCAPAVIPWQHVLAKHLRRAVDRKRGKRDHTFARPNRRAAVFNAAPCDPILPSTFDPVIEVAVAVDVSGSMGKAEMAEALREIDAILRATRTRMRVVACDAKVQDAGVVLRAEQAAALLHGGGGTDFRPVFDYLEPFHPGVTVFVTDGYGPAPKESPRWTDTIWLLVGENATAPCQWGEVIEAKQ